ncbi:unnamed protein product [Timema podura]|uniref:Uncharacterized protein n=1 Tax=Timema podura TaxID=61482 RepID=A0ABN7P6Y1_TIMPD|nr:unnamed protein product [Timema podura]
MYSFYSSIIQMCKKDLLTLDFESILKYFRVSLPKKCRNEEVARQLMRIATSLKVKKLKKYEHEFAALKGELSTVSCVGYRSHPSSVGGMDYDKSVCESKALILESE